MRVATATNDPGAPVRNAPTAPQDERQLLARHCAGDPDAFGELVACYRAPVYGFLVRRGVEPGARDDLFQEIFLQIHRAAASYRADAPLHPWLFTIVANTVRSHYRKLRVRRLVFTEAGPAPREPASAEADGHDVAVARETAERLDAGLVCLPAVQREVVLLCCVERFSHAQVGEMLGVPQATVRTRLARGRAALARMIANRPPEETDE